MTEIFSHPLSCNRDSVLFSHEFLIMPESPSPLLGRDILSLQRERSGLPGAAWAGPENNLLALSFDFGAACPAKHVLSCYF